MQLLIELLPIYHYKIVKCEVCGLGQRFVAFLKLFVVKQEVRCRFAVNASDKVLFGCREIIEVLSGDAPQVQFRLAGVLVEYVEPK